MIRTRRRHWVVVVAILPVLWQWQQWRVDRRHTRQILPGVRRARSEKSELF